MPPPDVDSSLQLLTDKVLVQAANCCWRSARCCCRAAHIDCSKCACSGNVQFAKALAEAAGIEKIAPPVPTKVRLVLLGSLLLPPAEACRLTPWCCRHKLLVPLTVNTPGTHRSKTARRGNGRSQRGSALRSEAYIAAGTAKGQIAGVVVQFQRSTGELNSADAIVNGRVGANRQRSGLQSCEAGVGFAPLSARYTRPVALAF